MKTTTIHPTPMKIWLMLLCLSLFLVACGGSEAEVDEPTATIETTEPIAEPTAEPTAETVEGAETDTEIEETVEEDDSHEHGADTHTHTGMVDIGLFFDGALAENATLVECTLSDGSESLCYEITIAGTPANHEIGPFCPETTDASADEVGIWFDGNAVYDVDGEFILGLAELYNDDNWKLYNDDGSVNVTENADEFYLAAQPQVDPSLQNHCVAGQIDWTESGGPVQQTVTIPVEPIMAETTSTGGNWGVTLNGVIIASSAPVDAILSAYTIAVFDDCGGHVNPFDGYHLHGARGCSEVGESTEDETPIFAYAMDGFPIHSALSDEQLALVELDECNGHETEEHGYHYHANPAEANSVLTCFKGLTVGGGEEAPGGRGDGAGPGDGADRGQGGAPDFAAAAEALGITEQALVDALGGPPPDFEAAAATLGIPAEELEAAIDGTTAEGQEAASPAEGTDGPAEPVSDGIEAVGTGRTFAIPGDSVFPEGVSYDATTGKFYVGATSDGTLYVGDVNGPNEMTVFSEGGADGRTAAIGTKVDADGNLWVAGGRTGQMFVYDTADGSLVASYTTPGTDAAFINDMAITDSGVYFTDSFRPILWRVTDLEGGEAEAWLDFTGSAINYVNGFNLNGIVATEDGRTLIVVHSGEGELYRIDVATQEVARIDTGVIPLTAGDGLALVSNTIYVLRNNFGEIVELELSADMTVGTGGATITSELFGYPTTIAYTGNTFLVANSQFNNQGGTPNLPFTVAQIPLP